LRKLSGARIGLIEKRDENKKPGKRLNHLISTTLLIQPNPIPLPVKHQNAMAAGVPYPEP